MTILTKVKFYVVAIHYDMMDEHKNSEAEVFETLVDANAYLQKKIEDFVEEFGIDKRLHSYSEFDLNTTHRSVYEGDIQRRILNADPDDILVAESDNHDWMWARIELKTL